MGINDKQSVSNLQLAAQEDDRGRGRIVFEDFA